VSVTKTFLKSWWQFNPLPLGAVHSIPSQR